MKTFIKKPQKSNFWFFSIFPIFPGAIRKIQLLALKSTRINGFSIFHFWDVLCNISSSGNMLTQKVVSNFFSKIPKNWLFYPKNGLFKLEMGFLGIQRIFHCKKLLKLFSKNPNLLKEDPLGAKGRNFRSKTDPKKVNFDLFGNKLQFFHIFHLFIIKTHFNSLLWLWSCSYGHFWGFQGFI